MVTGLVCLSPTSGILTTGVNITNSLPQTLLQHIGSKMSDLNLNSVVKLSSGYTLPLLGFGVYRNDDATPSVLEAFKAGYRHIDSAQMYRNEEQVGNALRQSGLSRGDVFITSKVPSKDHGYERALASIDGSLKSFGFEYIDLFLIHDPLSGKEARLATWKALLEARDAGKIRTVGVSNFSAKHLQEIRDADLEMPAVNQIELQPFCQQKPIVEYCRNNGIVVEAYCPVIRGEMNHEVIQSIAKKYSRDPGQILIRWSLQHEFVPLPKSATPKRIHSNAQVFDFALAEEDMNALDALDRGADGAISWNPVGGD
ncbi:NADP-dependent oxidoreductase domain superfamily protein [Pleurotus pulmonarius]